MATLLRRTTLFYNQLRQLHKSTDAFSVPTFNLNIERKAFQDVLPEVINSVVTGPKLSEVPEIGSWVKQLLEYILSGGKLGRGLMVSVGYRMFEEPDNFSEETQHSARILGWCSEMLQAHFLIMDDLVDGGTTRHGKPCWHLQPNVGLSAINDALLVYQSIMEILEINFGKTLIFPNLLRYYNETMYRATMGEHLDCWSGYNKQKNNIEILNMNRLNAIAVNKNAYYTFKLPIFVSLLLVKNGKEKATNELNNICMEFGRLMQVQDDYMDAYGNEIVTGKTGRDIQEGKCTWVAVTALQRCNDSQRSIFKEYYGSDDPEHVKQIKQLYDELHLPQLYEQCERTMYDGIVRRIHALPTEGERNFLLGVLNSTYKRLLDYTLGGGKLFRGLSVSIGYRMLEEPHNFSEETQHSARVLGWCIELLQTYFLTIDDMIDGATTRRGRLCWHQQPNVGLSAINDCVLMYQCMMEILEMNFGKTPFYTDLIALINETIYRASMGQYLDCTSGYNKHKNNINVFNMEHYNTIAIYKTAYHSFKLPILAALLLVKNGKEKANKELISICLEFGKVLQFQDDYLDVYGDEATIGKKGTDIQEGKCTWMAVTTLQRCNDAQRSIFKEYYGSKDPGHVKRIKQLYDELRLPQVYEQYERSVYEDLVLRIHALPTERDTKYFLGILHLYYKRLY